MKKPSVLLSLVTADNDFQLEQAAAAQQAARQFDAQVQVIYADSDAIQQGEQLLEMIHGRGSRPDAIIVQPAGGTSLPQVARAAVASGIGWVGLNREADYITEFRSTYQMPICSVSSHQSTKSHLHEQPMGPPLP